MGAVVLVSFVVIVIPMVLKPPLDAGTPRSAPNVTLEAQERIDVDNAVPPVTQPGQRGELALARTAQPVRRPAVEKGGGLPTHHKESGPVAAKSGVNARPNGRVSQMNGSSQPRWDGMKVTEFRDESVSSIGAVGRRIKAWAVQLGSFSKRSNAVALRDRLQEEGFAAFVRPTAMSDGRLTRVYVGPEFSKEGARHLSGALTKETQLSGLVVPYP